MGGGVRGQDRQRGGGLKMYRSQEASGVLGWGGEAAGREHGMANAGVMAHTGKSPIKELQRECREGSGY